MAKIDWEYCGEPSRIDDDGTLLFSLPFNSGEYLVTLSGGVVCMVDYDADDCVWNIHGDEEVIAWAELPEPYKPPKQIDNHPDAITTRKYVENDPETLKKLGIFD